MKRLYPHASTPSCRWACRSPDSRDGTQRPTDFRQAGPQVAQDIWPYPAFTPPYCLRWARRSPHARGCTTFPTPLLVGGPAGRLLHITVLNTRNPTGEPGGWPARRLATWRHSELHSLDYTYRWARMPHTARGCPEGNPASCRYARWSPNLLVALT